MANTLQQNTRINSIDIARGVAMVIMALDHTRDYFHQGAFIDDPTNLNTTTLVLFGTRWITHFCAPVFMLLTGVSAFLVGEKKGIKAMSFFLFSRGLFLVFLEFTVISLAWNFNFQYRELDFLVLWSLGVSMIALSALVYLPKRFILVLGIIIVAGHNVLDTVHVAGKGLNAFFWSILHEPGLYEYGGIKFFVAYPILPWIGIIALGYSLGGLYAKGIDTAVRKKWLMVMGAAAILLFIVVRATNIYGDPSPWKTQSTASLSLISFLNATKYPPSLMYALMTLGPALIFLAFAESFRGKVAGFFLIFGRTAMFYYILHIYLIHILATAAVVYSGHPWTDMIWQAFNNSEKLAGYGFSLGVVYAVWLLVIFILYPLCVRYNAYKSLHREKWWLSYI